VHFVLCYTDVMPKEQLWSRWARFLHRWGLSDFTAALLEVAGPLQFFAAQMLYAGEPLLGGTLLPGEWQALAKLLEDQRESRSFAAFLREETTR